MTDKARAMYCPHCHRQTSITPLKTHTGNSTISRDANGVDWFIGTCNYCFHPVLSQDQGAVVWPNPMPSDTSSDIPNNIRGNIIEAKKCNSVSSWRATVVMCRRAIQMACLEKGANPSDNLISQINYLKSSNIITQDLHEWATIVRWVGNDGAHPGGIEPDSEDASSMLDLAEQFLHVLYVAPARAAAHRAKLGK